jgi:catechol 2,3-dioxygenase-like lactoylglutathione lyase family enzyme
MIRNFGQDNPQSSGLIVRFSQNTMSTVIGIDHICSSCTDIYSSAKYFQQLGFMSLFEEVNLPLVPEKIPYLRENIDRQAMVFLKPLLGISVEMILHHEHLSRWDASYQVLLGTSLNPFHNARVTDVGSMGRAFEAALGLAVVRRGLPEFQIWYYQPVSQASLASGVAVVAVECMDLSRSLDFWKAGLGFSIVSASEREVPGWVLLRFDAVMPRWSGQVLLVQTKRKELTMSFLDDSGWTCMSFITTDLEESMNRLRTLGAQDIGRPFLLAFGGKAMRICFLRGPDSELIELIQFKPL